MAEAFTIKDRKQDERLFNRRMITIIFLIIFLVIAIFVRLVYLQIYHHQTYTHLSNKNQISILPIAPTRGLIYDRNGELIAENIPVFSLEIVPSRVKNIEQTIAELAQIVEITDEHIESFNRQRKQHRRFDNIPLRLQLTEDEVARLSVDQHRFPGVSIEARLIRHYPLGETMAHVVGYIGRINERELQAIDNVDYRATHFIGKLGIEAYFEDSLHGTVGYQEVETDASGRYLSVMKRTPSIPGENLFLTVDARLQKATQEALDNVVGAVVVMGVENSDILAMVSQPTYDPNIFVLGLSRDDYAKLTADPKQPLYNRSIRGQYPLASAIKPFLSIGALDQQIVQQGYRVFDPGWFKLSNSNHVFRCWKKRGHQWVNVSQAIIESCDTYFYTIATLMGITKIDKTLRKFGFGEKTGVEMKEELPGLIPNPTWKKQAKGQSWYPGDTVNFGIGQGYTLTTPLQLANATAILARRGKESYRPHLLLRRQNPYGDITFDQQETALENNTNNELKLSNEKNWQIVIDAMDQVVRGSSGTATRRFGSTKYTVAGKTGTAQVFSAKNYEHLDKKNLPKHLRDHSLFIAFAPVEKPEIAVAVIVEHDTNAVQITRKIMDKYFELK